MYDIGKMTVKATPEEIIKAFEDVFRKDDFLGERLSCLKYLPYKYVKPYLRDDVTISDWKQAGDEKLRAEFNFYRDWWRSKIENERGVSVHRGKEQFAIRMMLAGVTGMENAMGHGRRVLSAGRLELCVRAIWI